MSNDNDRIGLSGSTPDGQHLRFVAGLSGQTGWRRTFARVFALLWLTALVAAVVVAAVHILS